MRVTDIRFEHHREPIGIGQTHPRLTFRIGDAGPQWSQAGYEVEMTGVDGAVLGTYLVDSPDRVLVPWPGTALESGEHQVVRARLHGTGTGETSRWSDYYRVEAGLLHPADWSAQVVSPEADDPDAPDPRPAFLLRSDFSVSGEIASARLFVTALGVYEMNINGQRVGDHILSPGWTSYGDRIRYNTFDVTDLLRSGPNAWGAQLADGWFRGRLGFNGGIRDIYGTRTGLLAQLEIHYTDGTMTTVVTGPDWMSASGPITSASILDGEAYDARLERAGWSEPGHDTSGWVGVRILDVDPARLIAPDGPPVRATEEISPVQVVNTPSGATIIDFGQNLVGRVRIRVSGERGHTVTLRHAEVLENGELCTRPLWFAAATDTYTLAGNGIEQWQPRFTFHGFRYLQVDNWPSTVNPGDVVAVVLHTDMERTGWFSCSNPSLNKLHENVVWGMRGNFLDIPTDCPQRDERLGWTGDLQVFAPTAAYLYDCAGMLASWLKDLWVDQRKDPRQVPPLFSPLIPVKMDMPLPAENPAMAGWSDATVIVPWVLYQRFGDLEVLRRQYDSMCRYVDTVATLVGENGLWEQHFQFGDWLDPAAPPDRPAESRTPPTLVANAYLAYSARLLAEISGVLDHAEEQRRYQTLADAVRTAFVESFVLQPGRMSADAPGAYSLALQFNLLPDEAHRVAAGRRLAELTAAADYRVATGFLTTPLVADALESTGHLDEAYRLLLQRQSPSWLYQVDMGATTIWERWDSILPDASINPGEMTSFNHYALGSVADWMQRTIGGLAPSAPGYREITIRPRPGGDVTSARVEHTTPYGVASVDWSIQGGQLIVESVVPTGVTGTVDLPGVDPVIVGPGRHQHRVPWPAPTTVASGELCASAAAPAR